MKIDTELSRITNDIYKQKEAIIMGQLADFVSRGLIILEETEPVFVKDEFRGTISLKQGVRLILRDKDYIEQLEQENIRLKDKLAAIRNSLEETND